MLCSFAGCQKKAYAKSLCQAHYNRQWRGEENLDLKFNHMSEEIKEYMINEMKRGATLQALSEETGYKKASISKMFLREIGMNITAWRKKREEFERGRR